MGGSRGRRAVRGLAGVALVGALLASLLEIAPDTRPAGGLAELDALRGRDDLNLVLLLVDTLRADHTSAYGYERPTTPTLERWADSGIRFARVQAQSSWTKTSMASLWLGAYPARTGVLRHPDAIPEAATLPAEILREAGFRTVGLWRNGWVANNFGFGQGFDVYYRPRPGRADEPVRRSANPSAHPLTGTDLDATRAAVEFMHTYRDERFFLYVHYMDVHQYAYTEETALFGTDYADAYDNAVRWTDENVRRVLEALEGLGLLDRTVVVLASDHGEAFYEHGHEGHGRTLYREVTETPLLIQLPFRWPGGLVVTEPVENVDLWPTLLDLLGLPPLPGAQGRSLLPAVRAAARGEAPGSTRTTWAQLDRTWGRTGARPDVLVSVTRGSRRLLLPERAPEAAELYDHADDPWEQRDLADERPGAVAELREAALAHLRSGPAAWGGPEQRELGELRLQQLRALGYMGGPR